MRVDVAQHESLQVRISQAQAGRLGAGALDIPLIDQDALDKPHCSSTIAAGAMNECRLIAGLHDRLKKLVYDRRIRRSIVERDVEKIDAGGLRSSGFPFDIGSLLGRLTQVNNGSKSHFLDLGDSWRRDGTGA